MNRHFSLLTVALALWLIAFPLTFGFYREPAGVSDIFTGCVLFVLGILCFQLHKAWAGWLIAILGVWLQLSPLVFWASSGALYLNDTVMGALAILFAFQLNRRSNAVETSLAPKGWSLNPSAWSHRIPTVALALLAWFFSRYMAAYQLGYIDTIWDPVFGDGTHRVITSQISKDFPVSDAGLGAVCYTLEFLLGWQGGINRWLKMPWLVCVFALLVIPVGIVSITLIILQPVVVGAWCFWCLATAACMLMMIVLTAPELAALVQLLRGAYKKGDSLWQVFWKGDQEGKSGVKCTKEGKLGFTLQWNLLVTLALGVWLLVSAPADTAGKLATVHHILGPMAIAASVIAFAEVFRSVRYLNVLLGIALILAPWLLAESTPMSTANTMLTGVALALLSIRKGKITERYGMFA